MAAVQRRAISRVRETGTDGMKWECFGVLPSTKIGQTKHVGCMAVLGCSGDWRVTIGVVAKLYL